MAQLNILEFPDPRLRQRASPVERVTPRVTALIDDMLETMVDADGAGLAAPQVHVALAERHVRRGGAHRHGRPRAAGEEQP